jgi:hypothetical protein
MSAGLCPDRIGPQAPDSDYESDTAAVSPGATPANAIAGHCHCGQHWKCCPVLSAILNPKPMFGLGYCRGGYACPQYTAARIRALWASASDSERRRSKRGRRERGRPLASKAAVPGLHWTSRPPAADYEPRLGSPGPQTPRARLRLPGLVSASPLARLQLPWLVSDSG